MIKIRPYRESTDSKFLFATFINSYRYSNPIASASRPTDYFKSQAEGLRACLATPGVITLIAAAEDDEDLILGFLIAGSRGASVIHYIYTKAPFRTRGVASALIKHAKIDLTQKTFYTHWSMDFMRLGFGERFKLVYNPCMFHWKLGLRGEEYEDRRSSDYEGDVSYRGSVREQGS